MKKPKEKKPASNDITSQTGDFVKSNDENFSADDLISTKDAAKIIGTSPRNMSNWRENGKFKEDMTDHEGVFWYSAERVYQMKSSKTKAAQTDSTDEHTDILHAQVTDAELAAIKSLSYDERKDLNIKINQVDLRNVYPLDEQRRGFICPSCGNGSGHKGDGIVATRIDDADNWYFLHNCFKGHDFQGKLFSIIARENSLHYANDFFKILAIGKRFVDAAASNNVQDLPFLPTEKKYTPGQIAMRKQDIIDAQKNIADLPIVDRRNLSLQTLQDLGFGYIEKWQYSGNRINGIFYSSTPRIVAPYTDCTYNAIIPKSQRAKFKYLDKSMNEGQKGIFNFDSIQSGINFIVEGEFDAASFYEVGYKNVAALGGTGYNKLIARLNEKFPNKEDRLQIFFVVCLDNDVVGRTAAPYLVQALIAEGYPATSALLVPDTYKKYDANDILCNDGVDVLKSKIEQIIADAQNKIKYAIEKISATALPKFKAEYPIAEYNAVATARYVSTKQIFNDCPIDLTIPYGFKINSAGLFALKKDRDILISSTPPLITRKLRDAQEINYSYELTYRDGKGKWITCPTFYTGRFLIDNRQILALADKGLAIKPKETTHLTTYFNDLLHCDGNFSKIPTTLTYRQTGWINDFSDFVYPTDNDSRKVIRTGIPYDDLFARRGNKDIWLKALNTAQEQGGAIVRVVIGTALAAPLCRPLNLPNAQVHTDGQRGLGKTPLLKLAMSIFGNPRSGRLLRTFAATNKNFLEYAMAFNDLPLAVDERETLDARDADKRIGKMIYDFYEGVGNQAQRRDGTSRPVELFGGSRISNGEHPLLKDYDKAGAFKRVLPLHVDKLFNLDFSRELHTLTENNFGLFGEQWIDYIKNNLRTISDDYHAILKMIETKGVKIGTIHQTFDVEPTHLQTLTLALVAFRHFEKMLEIFRDADNLQLNDDFNRILSTLPTQAQLDDSTRALDFLKSFVAGNYRKFFGCKEVNEDFIGTDAFGQIYDDTGEVAFLPHKLRTILEDDGKFPSAESIINEFAQKGYLKTSKNMNNRYKTRNFSKSQKPVNVYMFLPNILWESAEDTEKAIVSDTDDELETDFPGTIIPNRKMPF